MKFRYVKNMLRLRLISVISKNKVGYSQQSVRKLFTSSFDRNKYSYQVYSLFAVTGVLGTSGFYLYFRGNGNCDGLVNEKNKNPNALQSRVYTMDEVSNHNTKENRVWVTYKDGVYDITDFIDKHPGGDNILLAAGSAIDPFWMIYGVHKQPSIIKMLEKYRIGSLSDDEKNDNMADMTDPYANDPKRSSIFQVNSKKPFNAEPPLLLLTHNFITPVDLFYVRNHLPVPEVDINSYSLEVSGLGITEKTFTLDDLKKKFQKTTIIATLQCAGNRRSEISKVKPVKGLNWDAGAIGNATWSGVLLRDVLKYCGFSEDGGCKARHIQFEGIDTDPANVPYGASIPIEKALDPRGDVILAYEMNGEPLSRDHGYPLRIVAPGIAGARSVKWLGRIIISEEESQSHWQQNDYKGFAPSVDWETVDFKTAPAIQEMPVVSAICEPVNGQKIKPQDGKIIANGYAWSGGGRKIIRVDVTADGGKFWKPAEIIQEDKNSGLTRCWAWTIWKAELPVPPNINEIDIWVKATDSSYNTQPESFENIWNLRGLLANAYHRIKVNIIS